MAQTAKQEATDRSSVRGLPRHGSRVERAGRIAVTARRTRRAASETFACGEASWRNATASDGAAANLTGRDEPNPMDARGGQPDRTERRQAIWPPRYNHLHLGGPVRAPQAWNQLNSRRNAIPAASSQQLQTVAEDRADDASASTRDHASATRHRSRMSRHHAAGCADRRSKTPPVTISIRDDATRHEPPLTKTLSLSVRPT